MSNHFKFRSLMSIIYALIMLLPVSSVAFRCAYTIFNKNAFESYYGDTINQEIIVYPTNIQPNHNYTLQLPTTKPVLLETSKIKCDINSFNSGYPAMDTYYQTNSERIYGLEFTNTNNAQRLYFLDSNLNSLDYYTVTNILVNIEFYSLNTGTINNNTNNYIFYYEYNNYSYLDNAFEYSLHEFIGNNGRGVLNLTDWFTSVFLQSSTHTQLYLDFINWYMNYTLLVSCVYILYLVLMWFVSLARRLLTNMIEKGGELK